MIDEKKLIEELRTWDMQDAYLPVHFIDLVEDQPKIDEWIPLSEKKPEEGQNIHVSLEYGVVSEGMYTKRYGFNLREGIICSNGDFINIRDVNAWMPKMKLKPYI